MRPRALVPAGLLLMAACSGTAGNTTISVDVTSTAVSTTTSTTLAVSISDEAAAYLQSALDLLKKHSINTDSVDWATLEESAFGFARIATTPAQTYLAITWALEMLDDDHSIFFHPGEAEDFTDGEAVFVNPVIETIEDTYGYVSVSRYLGDIGEQADQYATAVAESIVGIDPNVCGWIVDLTTDNGGNMWPMVAGLAPLLGEGTVGYFTYPDGRTEPWRLEGDTAWWDDMAMVATSSATTSSVGKPIAVLVGPVTASAGEAVATAFHGGPDVILIGEPTSGLTTSNEPVELSDGAVMMLTMSDFTDRNGHQFGQGISIEPDIAVATVEAESRAVQWLAEHPRCEG